MTTKYRIIPNLRHQQCLLIHPTTAKKLGIEYRKLTYLRFGVNCVEVKIILSMEAAPGEVSLDNQIIENLKIPLFASYEIKIKPYEIVIGPYIGILVHKKEETLDKNINVYSNYLYDYEAIGGVILAFSVEGIQMKCDKIRGYIFNPQTQKWEKGIYPYPAAVFKRTGMGKTMRNHIHRVIGDAIFNEYILNKWETYDWLSNFAEIKPYLPDSRIYNNKGDLKIYLKLYNKVYIKPIDGSQGIGIIEVVKDNEEFIVGYIKDGQTNKKQFTQENNMWDYIESFLRKGKFIVQRGIDLVHTNGRKNDFRLLIIKNNKGIWEDYGMIARYGVEGSIISNISGGGSAELGEVFLKNTLKLSEDRAYQLRKEISTIATRVGEAIDACGINCGNLGIDMGIDEKGNIWIIEVNNKDPNHTIALDAKDRQMFYGIKRANMLYAKRLAGF
ncbi:YheC/YheD family endospore coat-associated protein [Natronincola ferrireducens]|uniref:YheC/D like ATP-grasp n=1 Tax=Natronincola ferrireducens TaxID=393762 RepID=A0A1G9EAG6_9FIRM|nr:YheC/YheD family protein [Natronincola ferrireducens]SDK73149.1 YheC/D like ATP-grasp [Natronincola ferrireducens]